MQGGTGKSAFDGEKALITGKCECGELPGPDKLYITKCTIAGQPQCQPAYHRFGGLKAPWYETGNSLPRHEEWPED
jgi:hypothetical protein